MRSLSHVRLCDPVDCSPPGSSVHGIFQARALEWAAVCQCLKRRPEPFSPGHLPAISLNRAPPCVCPTTTSHPAPRLTGPDTNRGPQECHTLGGCSTFSTPIIQMWKLRLGGAHDSRYSSWGQRHWLGNPISGSWSKALSRDRHPSHPQHRTALTPSAVHKPHWRAWGTGERRHLCQTLHLHALTPS